ncbi:MAG: DUF3302 domain-containing protein [Sulfurovum sp.]|nr:DUF3302 domain-containing protein [Sulfurovaceae bacterium]
MNYTTFEYIALGIWIVVITVLIYGIIAIHDIPAKIAKNRNHPHHDAIEATGWISLFLLHALWPFLWIWAMTYDPTKKKNKKEAIDALKSELQTIKDRILVLETKNEII